MYQKRRNNTCFHKGQKWTWFKTIFDSKNSLLIVKVDLSDKHHEIRLLSLLKRMRITPEAQQLTRHSTHQDAGDVNLHGNGDWECDIRQQLKPSMFPWLIYIHTHTKTSFAVPCCKPPQTKKKKVACELQDLDRSDFRRDAQCAPVRARTGYWLSAESARTCTTNRHLGEGLCNELHRFTLNWKTSVGGDA